MLALCLPLFGGEDDTAWRQRTGVDPGKGPATTPTAADIKAIPDLLLWLDAGQGVTISGSGPNAKTFDHMGVS